MITVNIQSLKDRLSSYLRRAEEGERVVVPRGRRPIAALVSPEDLSRQDEEDRLEVLASRGLLIRPRAAEISGFLEPLVPAPGKSASEMVVEDRRGSLFSTSVR